MPQRSRFQAPRVIQDFATVQRALREVQESLDAATGSRAMLKVYTSDFSLVVGGFHRVSAGPGRDVKARLPAATGSNLSEPVTLHLEGMQGTVTVFAAPGQTVNGEETATFNVDGVVSLWSNGVNAWTGVAQLPAESPGGAALDANYVLGAAHGSLPNAAVGTDTAEVDFSYTPGGVATWVLNLASVGFNKLANLTGLSVLGRAANSSGVMAAITASGARQTLRANDAGTSLEWAHPVEVRDSGADQGDVYAIDYVAGPNVNLAASVAGGVATITPSVDLSSVTYTAGDGIDLAANQFSADVSDFAGTGLEDDGSNNLRISAAAAGAGLTGGGGSALAVGAGTGITVNANDVAWSGLSVQNNNSALGAFVGIDTTNTTSIIATSASNITEATVRFERAALTGAISAAQNVNATQFAGILDNGTLETARTFLNFVSTATDTTFSLTQDAGNDEIEVRVSTLGSFYAQNSGATVQTKFISFDNGTGTTASVVNNTGTSGYINVSFNVGAGDGIDVVGTTVAVDVSDFAGDGLEDDGSNNLRLAFDPSATAGGLLHFFYTFDTTTTMADPGSGDVRFNSATPSLVTQFVIDDLDENAIDVGIGGFQSPFSWGRLINAYVTFRSRANPFKFATYRTTTGNDQAGYWDATCVHIDSNGGNFTNGEQIDVFITPNGNNTFLAPIALDADMEAGTNLALVVPPGRMHRHPGVAKVWCEWNTTTTIFASYNVTSVTDTAAGTSTVVVDTDFSSTAYAPVVSAFHTSGTCRTSMFASGAAVGSFVVNSFNASGTLTDPTGWSCAVFGDHT